MADLPDLRSLLLPALWAVFGGTKVDADIRIDGKCLLVVAKSEKRELAFTITEKQIEDGSYKSPFKDNLNHLFEQVSA